MHSEHDVRSPLRSFFDWKPAAPRDADGAIREWLRDQMRHWPPRSVSLADAKAEFNALNANEPSAYLFRIVDSCVTLESKPDFEEMAIRNGNLFARRAAIYLRFFQECLTAYPVGLDGTFLMEMDDRPRLQVRAPRFNFQKRAGDAPILVHDIDFLRYDFDAGNRPKDELAFDHKENRAVFAGSTTGLGNTLESVRLLQNPRVAAMVFFRDIPDVDFRLPNIVQCPDPEARAALQGLGCGQARMDWQDQFKAKCIISMDGNGATCSRVVQALSSNSILLKYASDWRLVYFQFMRPWQHFIPISKHEDVLAVLARQEKEPAAFQHIAEEGRTFARTFLTKQVALRYTSDLLKSYLSLFG